MQVRSCFLLVTVVLLAQTRAELIVDPVRGFYSDPFPVTIRSTTPGKILYTLNGSLPDEEHGTPYTGPFRVEKTHVLRAAVLDGEGRPREITTQTYLFPGQVRHQEAEPDGYVKEVESWRLRYDQSFDWAMDPDIVNDEAAHGNLAAHLLALPTLSIVLERRDFNYLYRNPSTPFFAL